ncbi:MAG: GDP-mannose 4,6-dehydratase [Solirubrobacterales bacterium]|nr:GDP-mannose 4,6-dehydratase [Solirubrobacterales bacterium]
MKTLITGGAGFIGSHLADGLLERGDEVTVFDNLSSGKEKNLTGALEQGARLLVGDINDPTALAGAIGEAQPEVIFHLAAQGEVRRSIEEPVFDATANVVGTVNVIEAARVAGVRRIVFASSGGAIYGEGSDLPMPVVESSPLAPLCPYGQSKLGGEGYLDLYRRMYGLSSVALRFANVYGPRQNPKGEAGAVAIFGELLLAGRAPIVFGDGTQTRDFIYIDDLVEAILAASIADLEGPLNLGTGVETSLLELLEALADAGTTLNGDRPAGSFDPTFDEARPGEVKRIAVNPARAGELLGWSPSTGLRDGLERTLRAL